MDFTVLVEEITRLVCDRLAATSGGSGAFEVGPPPVPVRTSSVLVVLGRGVPATLGGFQYEALATTLETLARSTLVAFHVVPSPRFPCQDLPSRLPPLACTLRADHGDWEAESQAHQALLLPNAGIGTLAKLALLIADEPAVEAAVQFLLQDKPVLVGWDDVQMLLAHEGYHGRGVVDVIRQHVRSVQALGVSLGVGHELAERLGALVGSTGASAGSARGKAVVTQDDVYELSKRGQTRALYPPGSIVTALAWEAAAHLGIDITLQ